MTSGLLIARPMDEILTLPDGRNLILGYDPWSELHPEMPRAYTAYGTSFTGPFPIEGASIPNVASTSLSAPVIGKWMDRFTDATWDPVVSKGAPQAVTASTDNREAARALAGQRSDRMTLAENIIDQISSWVLMDGNWDNEGAAAPVASSLKGAVSFVSLLGEDYLLPEPMLLASGHAGLYWHDSGLYADLEFLADGRIAYFVEHRGEGRHKGVVKFDSRKIPVVFEALLRNRTTV